MNITEAFKTGVFNKSLKNNRLQRAANCLKWRQANQTSTQYVITLDDDTTSFSYQQYINPETAGIGTGKSQINTLTFNLMSFFRRNGRNNHATLLFC